MKPMVYIYIKDGMYQCLNVEQHLAAHEVYIDRGWKHSATIDASLWLEAYLNRGDTGRFELIEEISGADNGKTMPQLCKCGRTCAYYGTVGGYSVKCESCNEHKAKLGRKSRARCKSK